jgi:hypothetical protein
VLVTESFLVQNVALLLIGDESQQTAFRGGKKAFWYIFKNMNQACGNIKE